MITTEDDLWDALYSTLPPEPAKGEKTIAMMAHDMGKDYKTMKRIVDGWLKASPPPLEYVGKRLSFGKPADAYRVAK
jgi:hypothetical protein